MKEQPGNVAAYVALDRLVNAYARGVDRRDYALVRSVFHLDAIEDHGNYFSGSALDFVVKLADFLAPFKISSHCITNRLFEIDGSYAEGELTALMFVIPHAAPTQALQIGARYLDIYAKKNDEWKISNRKLVWDWSAALGVATGDFAIEQFGIVGRPDASDVSYEHFRLLRRHE